MSTPITRDQFEALRPAEARLITEERDGEYAYEAFLNDDGDEVAFASYKGGEAISFTKVDPA